MSTLPSTQSVSVEATVPTTSIGGLTRELVQRVRTRVSSIRRISATYRCQFHGSGFRLSDATDLVDYFRELGVSHLYCSPLMKSQRGSMHGYDVVDPTQLNDELGSPEDLKELVSRLTGAEMRTILDVVPNHMSVASDQNQWWLDVLKHGPASPFAMFFDIDWYPPKSELQGRILLPVLGAVSGEVLEAGKLSIAYRQGEFYLHCNDYHLPLDPKTCGDILSNELPEPMHVLDGGDQLEWLELRSIIAAMGHLPERAGDSPALMAERQREALVIQRRLHALVDSSPLIADHINRNLDQFNGIVGQPRTFDRLDRLLDSQAYRLVHWKASSDEINYRRFFDVTSLAALCVERFHVFEHTHRQVLQWAAQGWVSALRIDHVDGLFDPMLYLWRLQWYYLLMCGRNEFENLSVEQQAEVQWPEVEAAYLAGLRAELGGLDPAELLAARELERIPGLEQSTRHEAVMHFQGSLPLPVYVEKILGAEEPLPDQWPVLGTTGYEFLNALNGLFIDQHGFQQLTRQYQRFIGDHSRFEDIVYECKRLILSGPMRSEVTLLATRLDRLAHSSRYWRDFTLNALEFALQETIACFTVYRTYIRNALVSTRDAQVVQRAVAMAKRRNPAVETDAFDFLRDVLLLSEPRDLSDEAWCDRAYLVGRFQQVTSPVQAKGVEDTAFYRYMPLLSIDEVGSDPALAVTTPDEYHRHNQRRHAEWPQSMLATSTHDTKRSEDVRARINVLSEIPGLWRKTTQRWYRMNRKYVREVDGQDAPSRNDQWLLYQTLVGLWPVSEPGEAELAELISRLQQYVEKATKEAKLRTSWISPNPAYDAAVQHFIQAILGDGRSKFGQDLRAFVDSILDAGLINAASQVLLKLAAPGVADIYQGQELWDFSLVDPDNRRPVDYPLRRHLLGEIRHETRDPQSRQRFASYLASNPRDNRFKFWVTLEGLVFRRHLQAAEAEGRQQTIIEHLSGEPLRAPPSAALRYQPLTVHGTYANHIIAHAWIRPALADALSNEFGTDLLVGLVVVPRFLQTLANPVGTMNWHDTRIEVPAWSVPLISRFTAKQFAPHTHLMLSELLSPFPLALLTSHPDPRWPDPRWPDPR